MSLAHIFNQHRLQDIATGELEQLAQQYPYFPAAQVWLAKKYLQTNDERYAVQRCKVGIYACNPFLLQQYLQQQEAAEEPEKPSPVAVPLQKEGSKHAHDLQEHDLIRPLYTEDYFASQGIKLDQIDSSKKPTEAQLRSFTDWLRATRRPKGSPDPDNPEHSAPSRLHAIYVSEEEGGADPAVEKMAMASIATNEKIITESMAGVHIRQGQTAKAIAIYEKLSLLNPEKSDYFAQKIKELKK
jgi:hypothetical protein